MKMDNIKNICRYTLPILFGIGVLLSLTFYKATYGIKLIESDSASDILYAYILSQENTFVSKNWFFSTQIRIFDNELLFALLFKCFPTMGWWQIEVIGTMIMNGIMGGASVYFAYQLGFEHYSIWMFGLSLLPYGLSQTYYTLMHGCGYYGYSITQVYVILGIYWAIINSTNKIKRRKKYLFFSLFSFIIGLQGIRLLENLYIPLLLGSIIYCLYQNYSQKINFFTKTNTDKYILWTSLLGTSMALGGYAVNKVFLSNIFVFGSVENLNWKEFDIQPFAIMIREIISNLGYVDGLDLFSIGSLANIFALSLTLIIAAVFIDICRGKKLFIKENFITLYFLCALVIHFLIYTFLSIDYKPRYMLPFFMVLPHIIISYLRKKDISLNKNMILITVIAIGLVCFNTIFQTHINGNRGGIESTEKQTEMVNFLLENDFKYGFSTFMYTNSSVQHSDGKLKICPLASFTTFEKSNWLCTTDPIDISWSEKTFLIISEEQLSNERQMSWNQEDHIIWREGGIFVFEFQSVKELQQAFTVKTS